MQAQNPVIVGLGSLPTLFLTSVSLENLGIRVNNASTQTVVQNVVESPNSLPPFSQMRRASD